PDYSSKLYRGRLYFQPDVDLRLSASAGREENNYALQRQQSYYIRGVGALWKPGPRTTAELETEHRYFGPSRLARLEHRTHLTALTLAYSRNGSNYQQELLRLPQGTRRHCSTRSSPRALRIPPSGRRRSSSSCALPALRRFFPTRSPSTRSRSSCRNGWKPRRPCSASATRSSSPGSGLKPRRSRAWAASCPTPSRP